MKKKNLILVVVLFLFSLFAFKDVKASSNDNIDDIFNNYIEYYQNSDDLYDMSDRENITKTNYKIQDYNDSLYANNIEINYSPNKSIILGDDPVINIVPKECFYNVITEIYYGEEYVIFVDTNEIIQDNKIKAYKTHIAIIDINDNIELQEFVSYLKLSLNILFEYDYVTLIKNNDYVLPYWEQGLSSLNLMEVSSNIDLDYVVVPILKETNNTLVANPNSLIELSNIEMECLFLNSNDYNTNDQQYNFDHDNGCYISSVSVDYFVSSYDYGDYQLLNNYEQEFILDSLYSKFNKKEITPSMPTTIKDSLKYINNTDGIIRAFKSYLSNNSYSSQNDYIRGKYQQKEYFNGLIRMHKNKYVGPSLCEPIDHVTTNYRYEQGFLSSKTHTKIYEAFYCKLNYKDSYCDVISAKNKDLNIKEATVKIDTVLCDEYNVFGGKTTYNFNPSFSQELKIMCGNNDVKIYDNNILVSTSKTYNFIKGHDYKIEVVNNKSDLSNEIYNLYFKGKDIDEKTSLNNGESVLYTFIPSYSFVRYVESNADIDRFDLIYFENDKIYQFILTNNNSSNINSYLEIKSIPYVYTDIDGHIRNSEKYVRSSDIYPYDKFYKVEYRVSEGFCYEFINNEFSKIYDKYFIYTGDIYFDTRIIDSIDHTAHTRDMSIFYTDEYYKDYDLNDRNFSIPQTFYSKAKIRYEFLYKDYFDISFGNINVLLYGNSQNKTRIFDGDEIEFLDGEGEYIITIWFYLKNKNMRLNFYQYAFVYYYLPIVNIEYVDNHNENGMSKIDLKATYPCIIKTNTKEPLKIEVNGNAYVNYRIENKPFDKNTAYITIYESLDEIIGIDDISYVDINVCYDEYYKELTNVFSGENLLYKKSSKNQCRILLSYFSLDISEDGIYHIIRTFDQLTRALTYSEYGFVQYDDGLNYDVYIYGDVNNYNYRLLNDIYCFYKEIAVNKSIYFGGVFDGNDRTIYDLKFYIDESDSESKYRGIFTENYGIINDLSFYNAEFDYKQNKDVIKGLVTPLNRGEIQNVKVNDSKINDLYKAVKNSLCYYDNSCDSTNLIKESNNFSYKEKITTTQVLFRKRIYLLMKSFLYI